MKLIKRTTLIYQQGTSDKVYEVDLCQTSQDRYVVNFRYGRRGTNLKEGAKTVQAVPEAEAQKVFDKLVNSKIGGGYRVANAIASSNAPARQPTVSSNVPSINNARHQAVLNRLANQSNSKWPLERAIWRAGELKIREATPLLIQLVGTGDALRDYCLVWALGWCGNDTVISTLKRLYGNTTTPEFVQRIAFEALLKLSDEENRTKLRSLQLEQLPLELRQLAQNGPAKAFSKALRTYLNSGDYRRFAVLDSIYQLDNEYVRPGLLALLHDAPLKPNYFQRLRHIFKVAEYRHDAEVFGILASKFDKEAGTFNRKGYYNQELTSPQSKLAYSHETREYLRRRVWRTLKQLGEEGDSNYVKMAVGILLQYSDADAVPAMESVLYRWNYSNWTQTQHKRNWDTYAGYLTFNHILYSNSPRYVLMPNSQAWRCRDYQPGDLEPKVREEAFPELWERSPTSVIELLLKSNCRPVHHFAVKVCRVCQQFCAALDVEIVIKLLNQPYEITAELAFELASDRYNPNAPNCELALAVANCILPQARTQAHQWISLERDRFLASSDLIAGLVTSKHSDTRSFARTLLSSSILTEQTAKLLIGRIIALLLTLEPTQNSMAQEIAETLLASFTPQLSHLGLGVVFDLLQHPMPEIQALGARILLNHETKAARLPPELIESLLDSPHESVRGIGIRIFGQLPDETLIGSQRILLVAMAINAIADIRHAIRPIIRRLGADYPTFSTEMAADLIDVLLIPEKHEGVHGYLVQLLRELPGWMSGVTREIALKLLKAKSSAAQEVGGLVLSTNRQAWAAAFETSELVKLANHEILSVREAARELFEQNLHRIHGNPPEMLAAVRLLEAKWEDSREFAWRLFSTSVFDCDWTPEVLLGICDSIRENVRQFGRDLVTRNFREADGQNYLLKFSEHPAADMQMFATNYLENYAVDNPARLQELMPYFVTVLSQVNRGRVAKQRLFTFLGAEAQKSEAAARVVAEILTRQSVTIAIGDKAAAIQTMLKIHKTYPHLSLPIQLKPVSEVRT